MHLNFEIASVLITKKKWEKLYREWGGRRNISLKTHFLRNLQAWYENLSKGSTGKEKVKVNRIHEHRCKNPEENTSILNPAI
jgi:hypothetical protein